MNQSVATLPYDDRMRRDVRAKVERFAAELAADPVGRRVSAVVVSGSASRGEDRRADGGRGSDIDVMVITRSRSPLVGRRIAKILSRYASCGLEGGQVPVKTLATHATIGNFEAFTGGVVVAGDPKVLHSVVVQRGADIPVWEAVRLLMNRAFEHVKVRAGMSDESCCVAKTYEAIGEAALVLAGRYRPTFADRRRELEAGGVMPIVPMLADKYAATFRIRFDEDPQPIAEIKEAAADLSLALSAAITAYLDRDVSLAKAFDLIGARHRHTQLRVYWAIRRALADRDLRASYLRRDPCLVVWEDGLRCVHSGCTTAEARALVEQWCACPQTVEQSA